MSQQGLALMTIIPTIKEIQDMQILHIQISMAEVHKVYDPLKALGNLEAYANRKACQGLLLLLSDSPHL